jgi:predicted nucleotide-binding protein (sugar kinase/HSP70/actin superfamily)
LERTALAGNIAVIGFPDKANLLAVTPQLARALYDTLEQVQVWKSDSSHNRPKVGVLGNAGLLFTPFLNRQVLQRIEAEGCEPVLPAITDLLLTNAPLERQLTQLVAGGVRDIIYVQSFGCMSGHIHARGALKRIKQCFPQLNITFIDYDSGASEINQINRLKLALTLAHEGYAKAMDKR